MIELLATIAILAIIVSLVIYVSLEAVERTKNKGYKITKTNIESNAMSYVNEYGGEMFFLQDGISDKEYQCVTVENLIETGYLKEDVTESKISDSDVVKKDDYIYLERDKKTKTLLISEYNKEENKEECAEAVVASGRIDFELEPALESGKWVNRRNITITYVLKDGNPEDYVYQYKYVTDGTSCTGVVHDSIETDEYVMKDVDTNGTLCTKIIEEDGGSPLVTRNISIDDIDTVGPLVKLGNYIEGYVKESTTIGLKVDDDLSGVDASSFTKEDLVVTIGGDITSGIEIKRIDDNNYNLEINDDKLSGKVVITVKKDTVLDKSGNGNDKTVLETNVIFDNEAPRKPDIENPSNEKWTNKDFALILSTIEEGSGVDYWQYTYDKDATDSWITYSDSSSEEFTTTDFSKERNQLVYIRVFDKVGNCSDISQTYIKIDKTAPSKALINQESSTNSTVMLEYADNFGVIEYYFGTSDPSNNNVTYTSINSATSGSITKNMDSGKKYYFAVRDAAGNSTITQSTVQTYEVSYNANGGTGAPNSQEKVHGIALTLSSVIPTRDGYDFVSWNTSADGSGTSYDSGVSYISDASVTLYAQWMKKTYTITYDANGGTGAPDSQNKNYGENLTLSTTIPTRDGYNFVSWNTSVNGSGTSYASGAKYTSDTSITLYAQWKVKTYTVYYYRNYGGSYAANSYLCSKQYAHNSIVTVQCNHSDLTREGYEFLGWAKGSSATTATYQNGDTFGLSSNIYLYAVWKLKQYTITYYANGGVNNIDYQLKDHNVNINIEGKATRNNYTFFGWNNELGHIYEWNDSYSRNEDDAMWAIWEADTYTVSYNANGGTGAPTSQIKIYDKDLTISSAIPTHSDKEFNGWNTASNGNGTSYSSGDLYTQNKSITLYAQWKDKSSLATDINGVRYTCQNIDSTSYKQLGIHYITTCGTTNTSFCNYTSLNSMTSGHFSLRFDNLFASNNWKIIRGNLRSSYSGTDCAATGMYVTASSGLRCRSTPTTTEDNIVTTFSGCSYVNVSRTTTKYGECEKVQTCNWRGCSISEVCTASDYDWYYNADYGCYLSGEYLSESAPDSCSTSSGSTSSSCKSICAAFSSNGNGLVNAIDGEDVCYCCPKNVSSPNSDAYCAAFYK